MKTFLFCLVEENVGVSPGGQYHRVLFRVPHSCRRQPLASFSVRIISDWHLFQPIIFILCSIYDYPVIMIFQAASFPRKRIINFYCCCHSLLLLFIFSILDEPFDLDGKCYCKSWNIVSCLSIRRRFTLASRRIYLCTSLTVSYGIPSTNTTLQ